MWNALCQQSKWYTRHDDDFRDEGKRLRLNLDDDYNFVSPDNTNPPRLIGRDKASAQCKWKEPAMSSSEFLIIDKSMLNKLYKANHRMI